MKQGDDPELDKLMAESHIKYEAFMKEYREQHAACPKCGSEKYMTTLVGFIYNSEHPEEYKDLNDCTCSNCGNKHTAHERVPKTI